MAITNCVFNLLTGNYLVTIEALAMGQTERYQHDFVLIQVMGIILFCLLIWTGVHWSRKVFNADPMKLSSLIASGVAGIIAFLVLTVAAHHGLSYYMPFTLSSVWDLTIIAMLIATFSYAWIFYGLYGLGIICRQVEV
jgi:hypothetical protein